MPTYFITGVRSGIGLEYVRQLSSDPLNTVIGTVRNASDIESLADLNNHLKSPDVKGRVHIIECDLSSTESIDRVSSRLPATFQSHINTVILNAAILLSDREAETSLNVTANSMIEHFTTNTVGPALLLQRLIPHLSADAKIANITSGVASMAMLSDRRIPPHITAYSISKAALNMLTIHQSYHLKGRATVVCIDPGWVKTKMGGPGALIDVAKSASGVLTVIQKLTQKETGQFFFYDGTVSEW